MSCDMSDTSDVVRLKYSKASADRGHVIAEKWELDLSWYTACRHVSILVGRDVPLGYTVESNRSVLGSSR